jgi:hypothetical protein
VRLGRGYKVSWASVKNDKNYNNRERLQPIPDKTTKEFISLIKPNCSIAFRVNPFLISTRVTVSSESSNENPQSESVSLSAVSNT